MLWEQFLTKCTMQVKTEVPDGQGGVVTSFNDGSVFQAAIIKNSSAVERVAEKQGITASYTITTPSTVSLKFHDIFKRNSDNKTFRVISNALDSNPPKVATFSFNQVNAEEWCES